MLNKSVYYQIQTALYVLCIEKAYVYTVYSDIERNIDFEIHGITVYQKTNVIAPLKNRLLHQYIDSVFVSWIYKNFDIRLNSTEKDYIMQQFKGESDNILNYIDGHVKYEYLNTHRLPFLKGYLECLACFKPRKIK